MASEPPPERQLHLTEYWRERLDEMTRPAARGLVSSLSTANALCFELDGSQAAGASARKSKRTLVDFVIEEKEKAPDRLLLVRVGDFYEAYGLDALMLIEHAGLNPMGRKARAGCPWRNVQQTLDGLTGAGFTVGVYEEVGPPPSRYALKQRVLAQVVSPASPAYLYGASLTTDEIAYAEPPPYVGVCATASGYTLVQLHVDERCYRVHRRLAPAALRSLLLSRSHAPPLLVGHVERNDLAFLPPMRRTLHAPSPDVFPAEALRYVADQARRPTPPASHGNCGAPPLASDARQAQLDAASFTQLPTHAPLGDFGPESADLADAAPPRPLYLTTASQIGLARSRAVPDLPAALLPPGAPAACAHLLRRWLLLPPRAPVADATRAACAELASLTAPIPTHRHVPVGKLVRLLSMRQANVPFFDELRGMLALVRAALSAAPLRRLNEALITLVHEEAGVTVPLDALIEASDAAVERCAPRYPLVRLTHTRVTSSRLCRIDAIVSDSGDVEPPAWASDLGSDLGVLGPFFEKNEPYRGLLRSERAQGACESISTAADALTEAISADLDHLGSMQLGARVHHDIRNNGVHYSIAERRSDRRHWRDRLADHDADLGEDSPTNSPSAERYEPARDRHRKVIDKRFVSVAVREALATYLRACDAMEAVVAEQLGELCDSMRDELPALVSASHLALVSTTLEAHVRAALVKGWGLPELRPADSADRSLSVRGLWPYWMARSDAAANGFDLDGIWLLTAPNMAGKSSLMRATLVAALLANCGLLAPVASATVPRYDAFFLRTGAFDVPAEGKSAFAQEMEDVAVMASECTRRSLVMLDEIGRGTASREGAALATALVGWLDARNMSAIFATHLLPEMRPLMAAADPLPSLSLRTLSTSTTVDGRLRMEYRLVEGACDDPLAIHVARRAGVPAELIARAERLLDTSADPANYGAERAEKGAGAAPPAGGVDGASNGGGGGGLMRRIGDELLELSGANSALHVPAGHAPPPALAARSCVYVLQVSRDGAPPLPVASAVSAADADAATSLPPALYVGETDSISRRLDEHRRRHGAGATVECVLVETGSKTDALRLETRALRRLRQLGLGHLLNQNAAG